MTPVRRRRAFAACEVVDLVQPADAEWDRALEESGRAYRFSHRAAAGRAFATASPSYSFTPYRADYADGTRLLFPLITVKRRVRSLTMWLGMPFGLEGTPLPLAGSATAAHLCGFYEALGGHGRIDIHGGSGGSPPNVGEVRPTETHVLELAGGFQEVWDHSFTSKNRNMCRKAERAGVVVSQESGSEAVDAYYTLYAAAAASWGYDEPPYPRRLFDALIETDAAELWLARVDGTVASGAIFLRGSHDLLNWSTAMNRDFRNAAPGNAVHRSVIESGCERGLDYIDFGASEGLPDVESFKRAFGAVARPYTSVSLSSWDHRGAERLRRATARARVWR